MKDQRFHRYDGKFDPEKTYDLLINSFTYGYADKDPRKDMFLVKNCRIKYEGDGAEWRSEDGRRHSDQTIEFIKEVK